jgi:two-component system LytT family response regulator
MNLRVLVVDDEPLARLGVTARLRAHPDMTVVGECSSGEEALACMARLKPDLVFLDIQMPGMSGLHILKDLPEDQSPIIIFLTAHDDYAVEAFGVQALDYLLKPVDDKRFEDSLDRARRLWSMKQQEQVYGRLQSLLEAKAAHESEPLKRFAIRRGSDVTFVNAADIEWIEGLGDYAGLHVGSRTHLIRESLTSLENRLDKAQFLRIHRSTIVRIYSILRVEPLANRDYLITLQNQTSLRSSRTYSKAVRSLLRNEH